MKLLWILGFILTAPFALGQHGFETVIPNQPVDFSQITDSRAWLEGHWIAVDPNDKNSALTGPSASEISCDRQRKTCTDNNANIVVDGNAFSLSAAADEYTIERWNGKEIVASNIKGICRVRTVIKFDRAQKRVYLMQTLSEPIEELPENSKKLCKLAGLNLELKASTMWKK